MMRLSTTLKGVTAGLICVAGCMRSDGPTRVVVSGNVTLNGAPVEEGQIRYVPIDGTPGPIAIAAVRQGQYRCDDKGGVPVGTHRIEILAWDPNAPPGGRGEPARPQWAPSKYNENSELVRTVETSSGGVEHHFEL